MIIEKIKNDAENNASWAKANKLDTLDSKGLSLEVGKLQAGIENDLGRGKQRKTSFSTPGKLDRLGAKLGMTTRQMALFREVKAGDRKNTEKKLLEDLRKLYGESNPPTESTTPSSSPTIPPPIVT